MQAFAVVTVGFQSTLSRRERRLSSMFVFNFKKISIHALTKRATRYSVLHKVHQNISIHALTKRATRVDLLVKQSATISIHALTKRATITVDALNKTFKNFNPRSHEESDRFATFCGDLLLEISIHALTKRATYTYSEV